MKNTILELEARRKVARETLSKIDKAIKSLQEVCEHKDTNGKDAYEVEGNDSHKTYYKCKICGDEISV